MVGEDGLIVLVNITVVLMVILDIEEVMETAMIGIINMKWRGPMLVSLGVLV